LERFVKTSTTRREALLSFKILMNHSILGEALRRGDLNIFDLF